MRSFYCFSRMRSTTIPWLWDIIVVLANDLECEGKAVTEGQLEISPCLATALGLDQQAGSYSSWHIRGKFPIPEGRTALCKGMVFVDHTLLKFHMRLRAGAVRSTWYGRTCVANSAFRNPSFPCCFTVGVFGADRFTFLHRRAFTYRSFYTEDSFTNQKNMNLS